MAVRGGSGLPPFASLICAEALRRKSAPRSHSLLDQIVSDSVQKPLLIDLRRVALDLFDVFSHEGNEFHACVRGPLFAFSVQQKVFWILHFVQNSVAVHVNRRKSILDLALDLDLESLDYRLLLVLQVLDLFQLELALYD